MNKLTLSLTVLLTIAVQTVSGQIPQTISYQGVLNDADGNPVADGNYVLTFELYDTATDGEALYQEMLSEVNVWAAYSTPS